MPTICPVGPETTRHTPGMTRNRGGLSGKPAIRPVPRDRDLERRSGFGPLAGGSMRAAQRAPHPAVDAVGPDDEIGPEFIAAEVRTEGLRDRSR